MACVHSVVNNAKRLLQNRFPLSPDLKCREQAVGPLRSNVPTLRDTSLMVFQTRCEQPRSDCGKFIAFGKLKWCKLYGLKL